jgi:hypothetical protein
MPDEGETHKKATGKGFRYWQSLCLMLSSRVLYEKRGLLKCDRPDSQALGKREAEALLNRCLKQLNCRWRQPLASWRPRVPAE